MQEILFKNDRYKKNRGGHSRWLLLSCEKCQNKVAIYQKDGPGILKRTYLDRIFGQIETKENNFVCPKCSHRYELKAFQRRPHRSLVDGAFASMMQRVTSGTAPTLCLLERTEEWRIHSLTEIHSSFLIPDVVEKRPPGEAGNWLVEGIGEKSSRAKSGSKRAKKAKTAKTTRSKKKS